jgi:putative oxidoreductase
MVRDKSEWPQLAIRPVVGIGLIYHGGPMLLTAAGHDNFVHMLKQVGLPWPELMAYLVSALELVGGIAVLIGAFTVLFSLLVALEMLTRIIWIYLSGHGYPTPLPGQPALPDYETNLLYIGLLLALTIAGAGLCSVDAWRQRASGPASAIGYGNS